ncbi:hypothetical protein FAZ19_05660 [Sphingobacterium alkalisoli]|uniref:TonB C-terminal domain-containing protein n=1 Tax=Sphingobacterium alkalisoli TaxID=1874115 RepID=A0A4U0HA34_9SPHI|nr:energy transducer TonB [Sphingobacterium alkalisoli]TJY68740.1 hypothetical protein FAZ19_05660 [Sphingobacterium alkalisoli]GGH04419.1 hypothetical protein GCM10011418_00080 [Sphingobacterium alkalisoli]
MKWFWLGMFSSALISFTAKSDTSTSKIMHCLQDTSVVEHVDIYPQFRGGVKRWNEFLSRNLDIRNAIYAMDSTAYVDYGIKQTAILEFTVCEDGEVCDVEIVNQHNISPEFAKEALRVMKRSPKWSPGLVNGKPVRTRFRQSVTAVLGE